jgi:hypothetical protein
MATDAAITRRWRARRAAREVLLLGARRRRDPKLIRKREAQVAEAKRVIARHRPPPMRARAWEYMDELIHLKVSEVGGNNRGKRVEQIIRANHGTPGEPWCGDTVAACYLQAKSTSVRRSWASVRMLERILTRVRNPKRGHVVTYKFDHTGLFKEWAPEQGQGFFYAGEGNTGDSGARSDSRTGGDGVKLKLRHTDQVAGFYRVLR